MKPELSDFLSERGASADDIARADEEGWLPLLALDRALMPEAALYDADEIASLAGTDAETGRRLWRALGFPDIPPGVAAFSDTDVDALRLALPRLAPLSIEVFLRQVRIIAAALARVAAVEADMAAEAVDLIRLRGLDESEVALFIGQNLEWDIAERLVDYTHRLQFRAALWRRLTVDVAGPRIDITVGFADLAGYTELSEELDEEELDALLSRFEEIAYDTVAEEGARVVKTIGDEVMIAGVADDVARAALNLSARTRDDPTLPPVRAGLACGTLLSRNGDLYGPVVNLAHRITERARPGTVLVSEALHDTLRGDTAFEWRGLGVRKLRGIGDVHLWLLRRAGGHPPDPHAT